VRIGTILLARTLAPKLSELWGQPVTVENHPAAGPAQVAKSPADGYTLLINTSAQAHSAAILKNLPYDPLNRDGKLLPLGVTTARRSSLLPQVPTIAEAGVARFDFPIWYGLWVPARTPAAVVDKLSRDIGRVLAGPDLRDWITKHGAEPMRMTQPEFARFVQGESESAAWLISSRNP